MPLPVETSSQLTLPRFVAAAVQATPVFLDADATTAKACSLVREAARAGAKLIAFPEVFVPGYPYWNWTMTPVQGSPWFEALYRNAIDIPGPQVDAGTVAERILVSDGAAVGVLAGGRHLLARRAVLASVSPAALYGSLLPPQATSAVVQDEARAYRAGRGAVQIHIALDRPVRWRDPRLDGAALVHVSEGAASIAIAAAEAAAGRLPAEPTIVAGQQYVIDPSRVPPGGGALWLQLQEAPLHPVADGAGELRVEGRWTPGLADAYFARVLRRIERFAPGVEAGVVAAEILTPADLQSANLNAVGGDPYGGALQLDQSLLWRPLPSSRGHRTPVRRLWHIGAATHPGPGLGAGSGWLVARRLLRR